MFSKAFLVVGLCLVSLVFGVRVSGQQTSNAAAVITENNDREKDGLVGPVRRITVESSKITFKSGAPVEGPRVLRGVTTYDPRGKRVDTVAYPVEAATLPGKEQYKYDDKGNIVEMQLRGADGAILSKEIYRYEVDQLGNWKRMTTSLAVFQDGQLSDEPVEVTYRTITYFYSAETAKLAADSSNRKTTNVPARLPQATVPKTSNQVVTERAATQILAAKKTEPIFTSTVGETASNTSGRPNPADGGSTARSSGESAGSAAEGAKVASPSLTVRHVSEEVLRKAAISLPQPAYPEAAELARVQGQVHVEVIIDEQGLVTTARGMSNQPLLNEAAEVAARSARFSPAGLSAEPSKITGVITYDFVLVTPSMPAGAPEKPSAEKEKSTAPSLAPGPGANANSASVPAAASPPSQPVPEGPQTAIYFYKLGTAYLDSGKPGEAAQSLNKAIYKDPELAAAYVKLGVAYAALRQYKEAIAVFKMATRINRDVMDAEAYYQLGHAYAGLGKPSEALGAFKQALNLSKATVITPKGERPATVPTAEELHYSLGLAYHNLNRYLDAIKELQQVTAINPKLAEAYYGLALCYIGLGDKKSAEKQQKALATLNPELAERVAAALSTSRVLPPGVNEGMLGRRP